MQCRSSVADVVQQLSVADSLSREGTGASSSYCRPPVVPPVLQLKRCFKLSNFKYEKVLENISHNSSWNDFHKILQEFWFNLEMQMALLKVLDFEHLPGVTAEM